VLSVQQIGALDGAAPAGSQRFDVLNELGDCYSALGDLDRAKDCYRQAADLEPDRAAPYVGLGVAAIQLDRLDEAQIAFEAAARREPHCAEAYGGLAMIRQHRQDYPGAFDMHLKCLELDTDNLVALLGLFQTSCQMGTFAKVIHYLEIYLDRHPGDTSVLFCLATLYAREGQLDSARESVLSVLALEPGKAEAEQLLREIQKQLAEMKPQDALSA
jgi:tetratricopeptide (TPR) repeat protein